MRGGFVACLGRDDDELERIAEQTRFHRGRPVRAAWNGLAIAGFINGDDGPFIAADAEHLILTHGAAPAPVAQLERTRARFAALEWDGQILCASRDPLGLAPLFYRVFNGSAWLATEVRPLLALGALSVDLEALSARAVFAPLDETTGWAGILRVVPGCRLSIGKDLRVSSSAYWSPERIIGTYRGGQREAAAELRERLQTATRRCFEPGAAILLSGGLDSASVAVTAGSLGSAKPYLAHVHFPAITETHEQRYAKSIADCVGAPLHMINGDTAPWNLDAELELHGLPYSRLPFGIDEPALAQLANKEITVALDGHDGDGVLGPQGAEWGELILKGELRRLAALVQRYGLPRVIHRSAADLLPPQVPPRRRVRRLSYMQRVAMYCREPLRKKVSDDDIHRWRWPSKRWPTRQLQPLLPRAVISFEDKELEAARYGIDLRHPFADRELVEFLVSLPCAVKGDPEVPKSLLLEALSHDLPENLRGRAKSDYMAVVEHRVDRNLCFEMVRASRLRLPQVDYDRLFKEAENQPEMVPFMLLINLARIHRFAAIALNGALANESAA